MSHFAVGFSENIEKPICIPVATGPLDVSVGAAKVIAQSLLLLIDLYEQQKEQKEEA